MGARWPAGERPVVVECDPAGGDLLARFRLELLPGLVSLAVAARRSAQPGLVWQHTQWLPGGLSVVAGPAGAAQARAAMGEISDAQASVLRLSADQSDTVVIADCGRLDPGSPAMAVVQAADVMLLLTRAHDDALSHVAVRLEEAAHWSRRPCLVLVGDGCSTGEVSRALGIEVLARIPEDPKGAAACEGLPGRRATPTRSALGQAIVDIAALVSSHARSEPTAWGGRRLPRFAAVARFAPPTRRVRAPVPSPEEVRPDDAAGR
ncbi:hypothetical protein ACK1X7_37075 [Streptomyces sp. CY1]|uniref:hypothetical protein n=1 Tax=Streptomyces sp. CY1 TaxID=3388313 RepID=UPI0039A1EC66